MQKKYQIEGIGCGGCVASISKTLLEHPSIEQVHISMEKKGETTITMKDPVSFEELTSLVEKAGSYTIHEAMRTEN